MKKIDELVEHVSAALRDAEVKETGSSNAKSEEITKMIKKNYLLPNGRICKYCWQERYEGKDGKMHFGAVKPLSWEKFLEISNDPRLQQWQDEIRLLQEKYPQGGDDYEAEKKAIKGNFSLQTVHSYAFIGDMHRTDANALWNRKYVADFDHFSHNHNVNVREWLQAKLTPEFVAEQGIDYAYISVSGDGFHIIGSLRKGETISGAQLRICKALGLNDNEYDQKVYEQSRGSYFVHQSYWVIEPQEKDWYFTDLKEALAANEEGKRVLSYANNNTPKAVNNTQHQALVLSGNMPETYNGAKWEHIVRCLINSLGGEPEKGKRHDMYGTLCGYLHGLVNNNPTWLYNILPEWNDFDEQYDQCEYACNTGCTGRPAKVVLAAISAAKEMTRVEKYDVASLGLPPLTELDKLIFTQLPEKHRQHMLLALPAIKGALFHHCNYRNSSNYLRHFGFGCVIIGYPHSGKSFYKTVLPLLIAPLQEQTDEAEQLQHEYTASMKRCKNNAKNKKEQTEDPNVYYALLQADTTLARLAEHIRNANGDVQLILCDEIDDMTQAEKKNTSAKKVLLRRAYDGESWGQDRAGFDSVSGCGSVKINTLEAGTLEAVERFYDWKEIEDGLTSRRIFIHLPPRSAYEKKTVFTDYTAEQKRKITDIVYDFYDTMGTYYAPWVSEATDNWCTNKMLEYDGCNPYLTQYIGRAAEIAERAAIMRAIETGSALKSPRAKAKNTQKEKDDVAYALWFCEAVFRGQMLFVRDKLDKFAFASASTNSGKYCPKQALIDLNSTFTRADLEWLQDVHNWHPSVNNIIHVWLKTGKICYNEDGSYTKIK